MKFKNADNKFGVRHLQITDWDGDTLTVEVAEGRVYVAVNDGPYVAMGVEKFAEIAEKVAKEHQEQEAN